MSERVEYSQRRKEQCVHCAAGLPMPIKNGIHLLLTNDNSDWRHLHCTARDAEEEIAELRAKLEQAEKSIKEWEAAYLVLTDERNMWRDAHDFMNRKAAEYGVKLEQVTKERNEERSLAAEILGSRFTRAVESAAQKGAEDAE